MTTPSSNLSMRRSAPSDAAALYSASSSDDLLDRLTVMRSQESSAAYRPDDYLARLSADTTLREMTTMEMDEHVASRTKMCEWCYQLVDTCELSRHAVARSMQYLDRYLASSTKRARRALVDKREYQLAAMACLYTSVKIHEPLALDAHLLSEISAGCYDTAEIQDMELSILTALGWRVHGPTAHEFVAHFLGMLPPQSYGYDLDVLSDILDASAYHCEVAAVDYHLNATCLPSELAVASLLHALDGVDEDVLSLKARYRYLVKLCEALDGMDMGRVGHVQAMLRTMVDATAEETKTIPARSPSRRSVVDDDEDAWGAESDDDASMLCQEIRPSSPSVRVVSPGGHRCITPM